MPAARPAVRFLALACLLLYSTAHAQVQDPALPTLAVYPVQTSKKLPEAAQAKARQGRQQLTAQLEAALFSAKLFQLVERGRVDALVAEMQYQEVLSDSQTATLGHSLGASLILFPSVEGFPNAATGQQDLQLNFKLVDVQSSRILYVQSFSEKVEGQPAATPARPPVGRPGPGGRPGMAGRTGGNAGSAGGGGLNAEALEAAYAAILRKLRASLFVFYGRDKVLYPVLDVTRSKKGTPSSVTLFIKDPYFVRPGSTKFSLVRVVELVYGNDTERAVLPVVTLAVTAVQGSSVVCSIDAATTKDELRKLQELLDAKADLQGQLVGE